MKYLLAICVLFCVVLKTNAIDKYVPERPHPLSERWRWNEITIPNSLEFADYTQDESGVVWVAFNNRMHFLKSYDGYTWKDHPNPNKYTLGPVNTVFCSGDSVLIGGQNGLFSYKNGVYTTVLKQAENVKTRIHITAIQELWEESLIICTNYGFILIQNGQNYFYTHKKHLNIFEKQFPHFKMFALPEYLYSIKRNDFFVNNAQKIDNSKFWVYAQLTRPSVILVEKTSETENPLKFTLQEEKGIMPQFGMATKIHHSYNETWLASDTKYRPLSVLKNNSWQFFDLAKDYGWSNVHYSIVKMDDEHVVVGSKGEIYDYYKGEFIRLKKPDIPFTYSSKIKLLKTKNGNLLVGAHNKLYLVDYKFSSWSSYKNLSFQQETSNGEKWFLTKDNKVVKNQNQKWIVFDYNEGMIDAPVLVKVASNGVVWTAGSDRGRAALSYFKEGKWTKIEFDSLAVSFGAKAVHEDKNGYLWFSSSALNKSMNKGGTVKIRLNERGHIETKTYRNLKHVRTAFVPTPEGDLYAFSNILKYKYNEKKDRWEKVFISMDRIEDISVKDNVLWMISSERALLYWYEGRLKEYPISEFMEGKWFKNLHWVKDVLWMNTDYSFYAFHKNKCVKDALPAQVLMNSGQISLKSDASEQLWFNFYPDGWEDRVFNDNQYDRQAPFYTSRYVPDSVPPKIIQVNSIDKVDNKGNVTIRWKGADYFKRTPDERLLYSYRLTGEQWSTYTPNTSHTFLSLLSGDYSFEVKCMDTSFNESVSSMTVHFAVLPPIYKQWWFVVLFSSFMAIILFLVVKSIYKNRELQFLNTNLAKVNKQLEEKQQQIIRQKEEVYESKMRFFTNISHEFRTPLTLILGPLRKLAKQMSKVENKRTVSVIERNANTLLQLVNEIMDFRKMDAGHLKLGARETNMEVYCRELFLSFKELARQKKINFVFQTNFENEKIVWVDQRKFNKVLINFLSNAFKFTNDGGKISVKLSDKCVLDNTPLMNRIEIGDFDNNMRYFSICIEDSGKGIAPNDLESVFGRFYQVDENNEQQGTGIGLALAKEIVLLHRGMIIVESALYVGTRFTIMLPLGNQHLSKEEILISKDEELPFVQNIGSENYCKEKDNNKADNINKPIVLIVDDNPDIRSYLIEGLEKEYKVIEAENGKFGLEKVLDCLPDLIISDVMMPQMNGLELCAKLKTDIRTSHIPVVLLTARTSRDHQLEGLQTGADVYISKPFDIELLLAQVANLLNSREKLIQKLSQQSVYIPKEVSNNSLDQRFLEAIKKAIDDNLDNSEYKLDALSKELGMSIRNLHLKLKKLTGKTPADFLRDIRLNHAENLLKNSDFTVAEIAYQSGFSHPATFNRVFKQKHKITPLEFSKKK